MMKLSEYNYFCQLNYEEKILFNTFSGSILKIKNDTYHNLINDINLLSDDERCTLSKLGVLISDDTDEKKIIQFDRAKGMYSSDTITYRILTTTDCNARCFYCYEKGMKAEKMNLETANKIVDFIRIHSNKASKIKIQWFGGEPLLNTEVIDYITFHLKSYFREAEKACEFSMITNGYLIDRIDFNKVDLNKVQISLDGCEDEYNLRKRYIYSERSPFKKVIENINLLTQKGIHVSIRLNYDNNNYESIQNLIEELNILLKNKEKINVYPYPLFGTCIDHKNCNKGTTPEDLLLLLKSLIKYNLIKKSQVFRLGYRQTRCFACNANSLVIGTDGKLYKCTVDMNNDVGSVWTGISLNKHYMNWCNINVSEKCESCIFLPLCQGGCMAGQLNLSPVTCFLYKNVIDDILKLICEGTLKS